MTGWAERTISLVMALLLLPLAATAAPSPIHEDSLALTEALSLFVHNTSGRKQGARVGDWYLHPLGFGFVIPDGLSLAQKQAEKTVTLVETAARKDTAFRTSISIVVAEPDTRLATMTRGSVKDIYENAFNRFELIDFSYEVLYDVPVVCLSFYSGRSPRLFLRQRIFIKDGHSFVITLTAQNSVKALPDALQWYEELCTSLLFIEERR